jgi:hypothetical protein
MHELDSSGSGQGINDAPFANIYMYRNILAFYRNESYKFEILLSHKYPVKRRFETEVPLNTVLCYQV